MRRGLTLVLFGLTSAERERRCRKIAKIANIGEDLLDEDLLDMQTFSDESRRSLWDLNQSSSEKLKCDFKLWNLKCLSVKSF